MSLTLHVADGCATSVSRSSSDRMLMAEIGARSVARAQEITGVADRTASRSARRCVLRDVRQRSADCRPGTAPRRAPRRCRCRAAARPPGPAWRPRGRHPWWRCATRGALAAQGIDDAVADAMHPELTVPARPRKSRPSRSTVCTGMRKGPRGRVSAARRCAPDARAASAPCTRACARSGARRCRRRRPRPEWRSPPGNRSAASASRKSASMACGTVLRPVDEIHLVDGENDALHADEIEDRGVAAGLLLDAVARVDQHDGDVGVRGARRHVARVLLMAGAVDDHEAAASRCRSSARRCRW